MKFLVTGGAGFIGTNTVRRLVHDGHEVLVFDNLSTGKLENIADIASHLVFVNGDIRKKEDLDRVMRGVEVIIHLAAYRAVFRSMEDPWGVTENNVMGTLNVLLAARDAKVRRVVFASTSSILGKKQGEGPEREDEYPTPVSPYAASKIAGEHYMHVFANSFGVETVSLRYFNVFGPYQHPESKYSAVIPIFVRQLMREEQPTIDGDGEQSKDFTYVENVVEANLLAAAAPSSVSGMVFHIGGGVSTSVNVLFELIRKGLGKRHIKPTFGPPRPGDVRRSLADITRAKKYLGYEPKWTLEDGLAKTLEWYKERFL